MFNVIPLANILLAIVATALLPLVLCLNVGFAVTPLASSLSNPLPDTVYQFGVVGAAITLLNRTEFIGVLQMPTLISLQSTLLMFLIVAPIILAFFIGASGPSSTLSGSSFIRVVSSPISYAFSYFLSIGRTLTPFAGVAQYTLFTFGRKTRAKPLIFRKILWRCRVTQAAFCAAFERERCIYHSVSLSLYLGLLSAGGEINRRSGATLADLMIIPQNGAVY